jgi:hypothetical protein
MAWVPSPPGAASAPAPRGDGVVYELLQIITPMQFHGFDPANGGLLGQSDLGTYGSVTAGG